MQDRRYYSREVVNIDAALYTSDNDISCKVIDISENGLCFEIDKARFETLDIKPNMAISFQFIDNTLLGSKIKIVSEKAVVVHSILKDNVFHIGCKLYSKDFENYVTQKKFLRYYKNRASIYC